MAAATPADSQCDLPKVAVKRIVKEKLAIIPGGKADLMINKEALLAFGESAKVCVVSYQLCLIAKIPQQSV
jgi:hypothetical protein